MLVPSISSKSPSFQAYRSAESGDLRCFEAYDGTLYRKGDYVFVETAAAEPYCIGSIQHFRMVGSFDLLIS